MQAPEFVGELNKGRTSLFSFRDQDVGSGVLVRVVNKCRRQPSSVQGLMQAQECFSGGCTRAGPRLL